MAVVTKTFVACTWHLYQLKQAQESFLVPCLDQHLLSFYSVWAALQVFRGCKADRGGLFDMQTCPVSDQTNPGCFADLPAVCLGRRTSMDEWMNEFFSIYAVGPLHLPFQALATLVTHRCPSRFVATSQAWSFQVGWNPFAARASCRPSVLCGNSI